VRRERGWREGWCRRTIAKRERFLAVDDAPLKTYTKKCTFDSFYFYAAPRLGVRRRTPRERHANATLDHGAFAASSSAFSSSRALARASELSNVAFRFRYPNEPKAPLARTVSARRNAPALARLSRPETMAPGFGPTPRSS
jgi:hypothetical protein